MARIPFDVDWVSVFFFGGASYQLWFVPALLIWSAVFAPLMFVVTKKKFLPAWGILLMISGIWFFWLVPEILRGFIIPVGYEMVKHMFGCAGYVPIGMGAWWLCSSIGNFKIKAKSENKKSYIGFEIISGFLLIILAYWGLATGNLKEYFVPLYSVGIFLIFLAFIFPEKKIITRYLAPCSFGIYLCHGIFVEGFQVMARMSGFDVGRFSVTLFIIAASFIFSAFLCVALMNNKYTKWLIL